MSKTLHLHQYSPLNQLVKFDKNLRHRFGLIFAASAFLLLAAPAFLELPSSKLLAQGNVVSQDLDAAMLYQMGVTRYQRQDFQGAEIAFRQALEIDPNIGLARNYLGNIFMAQNRLDLAVQEYGEAVRINPEFGEAYYNLGLAFQKQEKFEDAISAYRQALDINPKMATAHYNLGLVLYQQELREDAISAYEEAIKLDNTNANAYLNLAVVLQQEGEIEKAISNYRQVIKLDPKNTLAYNNLGALLIIEEKPLEAIAVYQQAINQNPQNPVAYYNLGITLYNQGNLKLANQLLKRARQQYYQQGNTEQANKIDEMTQKIAQVLEPKKTEFTPATTPENNSENNPDTDANILLPPPETAAPVTPKNSVDDVNTDTEKKTPENTEAIPTETKDNDTEKE